MPDLGREVQKSVSWVQGEYNMAKLATATRKAQKPASELHFIARAQFKATGAVLYGIRSVNVKTSAENIYHVTVVEGKVTGCYNVTEQDDCKGYHFNGHCHHEAYVNRLEEQRAQTQNELDGAQVVAPLVLGTFADDLQAHLEDEMPAQPEGEMEQQAWAIIAAEQATLPVSCACCGRLSKQVMCAWCLGVAA